MIARLLNLLRHKRVRDIVGWLGGGLVVVGGGVWSLWTYYHPQPPATATAPAPVTGKAPAGMAATPALAAPAPVAQPPAPAAAPIQQAKASDSGMAVNRIGKGAAPIGQSAEAGSGGIAVNAGPGAIVDIHQANRDPDVARLLQMLAVKDLAYAKAMADKDRTHAVERKRLLDQNQALTQQLLADRTSAVIGTVERGRQPNATPTDKAALAGLERGDTQPTEAALLAREQTLATQGRPQRAAAAQAARERGALAAQRSVAEAVLAYKAARGYEPDNLTTLHTLVDLTMVQGRSDADKTEYLAMQRAVEAAAQAQPGAANAHRDLSVGLNKIGNVLRAEGEPDGALATFRKDLEIAETLAQRDPGSTEWQRHMSISHDRIGNALRAQGDLGGALAAFRKGLEIRDTLARRNPGNKQWQRDLSYSHSKIGEVLRDQGDATGSLAAFRQGLAIADRQARLDPSNAIWQTDWAEFAEAITRFDTLVPIDERRRLLTTGQSVIRALQAAQRLKRDDEWLVKAFEEAIAKLP